MSSVDYTLTFAAAAERDLRDILSYTLRVWGEGQAVTYRGILDEAFKKILQFPDKGRANLPPYRTAKAGRHIIFYTVHGRDIAVVRVLHGSMDFIQHLDSL